MMLRIFDDPGKLWPLAFIMEEALKVDLPFPGLNIVCDVG